MMRRYLSLIFVILAAVALAANASAEKTVPVNASPGAFDQPSVAVEGNVNHVTYIGADNTAGPFRLFYAAVDGGADFSNLSLTRDTTGFLVTPPTAIDNTAAGNDAYADARHPKIALRSSTEVVIFFQAKPAASPDPTYALYLARLTLENKAVVKQSVRRVTGISGFGEDVSFGLVTADNTARLAYANRPATSPTAPFQVFYSRVRLDDATVVGSPLPLSPGTGDTFTGSDGYRPIPSLRLDGQNRAHVAWAANSNSLNPNGIYYALVKETNGADGVAIAATQVLGRSRKWGFPNVLVSATGSIFILAADESLPGTSGNLGLVNINPDADDQDGSPVQVPTNTNFILTPPGESILPEGFSLFRPGPGHGKQKPGRDRPAHGECGTVRRNGVQGRDQPRIGRARKGPRCSRAPAAGGRSGTPPIRKESTCGVGDSPGGGGCGSSRASCCSSSSFSSRSPTRSRTT